MKSLEERRREYPYLYERISRLVEVVENTDGDVVKADEAERRVLEESRKMGQEPLQSWADRKNKRVERAADTDPALQRKEKSLYLQTRFGRIEVEEQTYRRGRSRPVASPFARSAGVECCSYSLGLQRVLADFGADESFKDAGWKVREHYGIEVSESAPRRWSERHGAAVL